MTPQLCQTWHTSDGQDAQPLWPVRLHENWTAQYLCHRLRLLDIVCYRAGEQLLKYLGYPAVQVALWVAQVLIV